MNWEQRWLALIAFLSVLNSARCEELAVAQRGCGGNTHSWTVSAHTRAPGLPPPPPGVWTCRIVATLQPRAPWLRRSWETEGLLRRSDSSTSAETSQRDHSGSQGLYATSWAITTNLWWSEASRESKSHYCPNNCSGGEEKTENCPKWLA